MAHGDIVQGKEYLLPWQKEKMQGYLRKEDQQYSLVAGLMLLYAFGAEAVQSLRVTAEGKPYFPEGVHGQKHFSISHAGEYVVLATGEHPLGVDVEKIAPYTAAAVNMCFTAREQAWLQQQSSAQAFWRIWTAKESIMKGTGCGFALHPHVVEILPVQDGAITVLGQTWFIQWVDTLANHILCLASVIPVHAYTLVSLSQEQLRNKLKNAI